MSKKEKSPFESLVMPTQNKIHTERRVVETRQTFSDDQSHFTCQRNK